MTETDQTHISDALLDDETEEIIIEATQPKTRSTRARRPRRPLLRRLFGLSIWGAVKLSIWCILVGFFILASQFDPRSPSFDAVAAISGVAKDAWVAAGWAVMNFWKPALAGATIVLPVWTIWRLITLPFRK